MTEPRNNWQPEQPTLIVIDYAAARTEEVRNLLLGLLIRVDLAHPVRILLLERDTSTRWLEELARGGQEQGLIESIRHDELYRLGPLDPAGQWATMRAVFGDRAAEFDSRRPELLDALAEIDSGGRPLFAAMVADAVLAGGDPRGGTRARSCVMC